MTRGRLLAGVASIALFAGPAKAADVLTVALSAPAPSSWAGGYVGVTAGGAWGAFGTATSTPVNPSNFFSDAAVVGAINAAGANSAKTNVFATGIEVGYNWQNGPFLLGVEADLQSLHLNGAASSGAIRYPDGGGQFVVTSYSAANWLFTARARAGLVAGNGALFFLTGGLAVTHLNTDFVFSPANGVAESAKLDAAKAGYVIGGGAEAPLTDRLSVKAEYLHDVVEMDRRGRHRICAHQQLDDVPRIRSHRLIGHECLIPAGRRDQRPGHLGPSADRCRQARRELQIRLGRHRRAALMSDVTNVFTAAIQDDAAQVQSSANAYHRYFRRGVAVGLARNIHSK